MISAFSPGIFYKRDLFIKTAEKECSLSAAGAGYMEPAIGSSY